MPHEYFIVTVIPGGNKHIFDTLNQPFDRTWWVESLHLNGALWAHSRHGKITNFEAHPKITHPGQQILTIMWAKTMS